MRKKYINQYQTPFLYRFGIKKEINAFIENLSIFLSAGMDINSSISSIFEETDSLRAKKIIGSIQKQITSGSSLYKSFLNVGVFSDRVLSLVRAGEQSGKLVENLEVVVLQNEKEALFKSKVRSSLIYSTLVFSLAIVAGTGTIWFTLPKLSAFFVEMNAQLPLATRILIKIGEIISKYGEFIFPSLAVIILSSFYFLFSFPKTKFIGHALLFHLPIIKNLIKDSEIARFGYLFGTMVKSGMPIVDSIRTLQGTTTFKNYQKFYIYLEKEVGVGSSLKMIFSRYRKIRKLFPSQVRQMVGAAEQAGKLSEILIKIGKIYEEKTETTAKNLPVILEPVLLIMIGLVVAFITIGIILPIYNLSFII